MSWNDLVGHDQQIERFRRASRHGYLASSYLLVGPSGIGKRKFSMGLAQALLCDSPDGGSSSLLACGTCAPCQMVLAGTHPDISIVFKPDDKQNIPLKTLIGEENNRMREGLCYEVSRKPYYGGYKLGIIDDADFLNEEGTNALLKTLEEPPPRTLLILIGTSEHRQAPTILSRCQIVRFQPLSEAEVAEILLNRGLAEDTATATSLAAVSDGSVKQALRLAEPEMREFRDLLHQRLASGEPGDLDFAKQIESYVKAVGKDSKLQRSRFQMICGWAISFYRAKMLAETENTQRQSTWADCVELCLNAQSYSHANINQANLTEFWLSSLTKKATSLA